MAADNDMDQFLDDALGEFEDENTFESTRDWREDINSAAIRAAEASEKANRELEASDVSDITEKMQKLMQELQNPNFSSVLEETLKGIGEGTEGDQQLQNLLQDLSQDQSSTAVADLLKELAETASKMEGMDSESAERMGEEIMQKMLKELSDMGNKDDQSDIMDGMMKQLLAKEVMHEPMKMICEKFPEWLADNQESLSQEEYERYGRMYQYFQEMVHLYETEPDNYEKHLEVMQELQECGQPPAEIMKELAPGLEFNSDGTPQIPGMGLDSSDTQCAIM